MEKLDALLHWYATLDRASLARIAEFYGEGAEFKDPFNEVRGLPAIRAVFEHMFDSTDNPRFVILARMAQEDAGFATWRFEFALKGKRYTVLGASHIRFDAQGKVSVHRDYWDPAEELWQKLPLIGRPVRWLRGRFRAG